MEPSSPFALEPVPNSCPYVDVAVEAYPIIKSGPFGAEQING